MLTTKHSSLTALALVFATAAFSQGSSAANAACPGKAPTSLSAATTAKPTLRAKIVAGQATAKRAAKTPCDDKKIVIQGAPAKLKVKTAQPLQPTRLKIKLPGKIKPKKVLTTKIAPKKPGVIVAVPGGSNGGPFQPAGDKVLTGHPAGDGVPKWHQIGGQTAYVPMVHGACGADCFQHVLSNENGNKNVNGAISLSCPAGQVVTNLYYVVNAAVSAQLATAPYQQSLSVPVVLQPWTPFDFQYNGQLAFGGSWDLALHDNPNPNATEQAVMNRQVTVIGACGTGDEEFPDSEVESDYQATTTATFQDLDFNS